MYDAWVSIILYEYTQNKRNPKDFPVPSPFFAVKQVSSASKLMVCADEHNVSGYEMIKHTLLEKNPTRNFEYPELLYIANDFNNSIALFLSLQVILNLSLPLFQKTTE